MSVSSLRPFGPDLWLVDGPETDVAGFRYPTRMAVVRLAAGGLFVWSPVGLSDDLRADLDALGEVRCLIAPNSLHHVFLEEWRTVYPQARLHAAPGFERRVGLVPDAELGDTPSVEWAEDLDQVVVRGNRITTEVVFFHRRSATVLFTDLLQQFPRGWFRGWRAIVARLDLMTEPSPATPRKFRIAFFDRAAGRAALGGILEWPAERVVMAHGPPVERDGRAFIAGAFRWLTG